MSGTETIFRTKYSESAKLTNVGSLSSWRSAHVKNALILLRGQGHDGEERSRSLNHVMPSQVLGSGTCAPDTDK
jgi:hypothetical protein